MQQQSPPEVPDVFQLAEHIRAIRRDPDALSELEEDPYPEYFAYERRILGEERAAIDKMRADPSEDAAIDVDLWDARQMIETGQEMIAEGKRNLKLAEAKNREAKLRYSSYRMRQRLGKIEAILAETAGPEAAPRPGLKSATVADLPPSSRFNPFIGGGQYVTT